MQTRETHSHFLAKARKFRREHKFLFHIFSISKQIKIFARTKNPNLISAIFRPEHSISYLYGALSPTPLKQFYISLSLSVSYSDSFVRGSSIGGTYARVLSPKMGGHPRGIRLYQEGQGSRWPVFLRKKTYHLFRHKNPPGLSRGLLGCEAPTLGQPADNPLHPRRWRGWRGGVFRDAFCRGFATCLLYKIPGTARFLDISHITHHVSRFICPASAGHDGGRRWGWTWRTSPGR